MNNNIKENELRIGNLVSYDGRIFEIDTIAKEFPTLNTIEFGIGVVDWGNIKPIPLTEEWLIKFGFKKDGSEWKLYPCFEVTIIAFNEDNYNGVMFYTRTIHTDYTPIYCGNYINYIHQLQNLYFALTNEELIMK